MEQKTLLSNSAYDVLKWISLIALNAIGLCYMSISAVWNLPYGDEINRTCQALSLFLGTLIGVSTAQYNSINK